ncbi:Basic leucine zipper and W2 domain-containing protein 2, partial [Bonamia ostreae]
HCVRILYDTEILFEEVILNWWKEINERKTKGVLESRNNDLLNAIRIFIEWLSSEEYEESSE